MPRTKTGKTRAKKHKKIKKEAKGFKHARRKRVKIAKESILHAGDYAYRGRKNKKRDLKKLWIMRINAAARDHDLKYSTFMGGLSKAGVELNRKMIADIAVNDPETFENLVDVAKKEL